MFILCNDPGMVCGAPTAHARAHARAHAQHTHGARAALAWDTYGAQLFQEREVVAVV